jgi:hypothetical protein
MGKFGEALRAKYKTPRAAIAALGLDPSLLEKEIIVGDSRGSPQGSKERKMQRQTKSPQMSRQAALGIAVLASHLRRPKILAKDARLDLNKIFSGVTAKNFPQKKKTILRLLKPKLASDATIGEVAELLDMIDSHGVETDTATPKQCKTVSKMTPPLDEEEETSDEEEAVEREAGGEQAEHLREEENHQKEDDDAEEEEEDREDAEEEEEGEEGEGEEGEGNDPHSRLKSFLKGKVSDEDMEHVSRIMNGDEEADMDAEDSDAEDSDAEDGADDEDGSETEQERRDDEKARKEMEATNGKDKRAKDKRAKDKRAKDRCAEDKGATDKKDKHVMDRRKKRASDTEAGPPPFKGMPKPGGGMVDKKAMDAALDRAVADATRRTMDLSRQIRVAERFVMPWIGDAALDEAESPEEVYKIALDSLQIDVDDVHPSAWKKILEMTPRPGTVGARSGASPIAAADSVPSKNALKLVDSLTPGISRIKQL